MAGTRGGLGRIVAMGVALAVALLLLLAGEARAGSYRVAQCGWYVGAARDVAAAAGRGRRGRWRRRWALALRTRMIVADRRAQALLVGRRRLSRRSGCGAASIACHSPAGRKYRVYPANSSSPPSPDKATVTYCRVNLETR